MFLFLLDYSLGLNTVLMFVLMIFDHVGQIMHGYKMSSKQGRHSFSSHGESESYITDLRHWLRHSCEDVIIKSLTQLQHWFCARRHILDTYLTFLSFTTNWMYLTGKIISVSYSVGDITSFSGYSASFGQISVENCTVAFWIKQNVFNQSISYETDVMTAFNSSKTWTPL